MAGRLVLHRQVVRLPFGPLVAEINMIITILVELLLDVAMGDFRIIKQVN
jgi:hypothetical protein